MTLENQIAGALAGMVMGDAMGVPGELWPREKVRERFGFIDMGQKTTLWLATLRPVTIRTTPHKLL